MKTFLLVAVCLFAASPPDLAARPRLLRGDVQPGEQPMLNEKTARSLIIPQLMPDSEADVVIKDICEHVGLACNFSTFPARIPNAMAYMIDAKRVVMYNPEFIQNLHDRNGQPSWSTLSVLVHEIGHHLLGHIFVTDADFPGRELEADRFSGFMLYRMGATLAEAQANIRVMAQESETPSHPARSRRIAAIEEGWQAARAVTLHEKELDAKRVERSGK